MTALDLDAWLPEPSLRVIQQRPSHVSPEQLWEAARTVPLSETGRLGRLIRWRIPGIPNEIAFGEMFRRPPFIVLQEHEQGLVSGLVGRIWTLRRDYPALDSPDEFRSWSARGTARVVFGHWAEASPDGGSVIVSDARVQSLGIQGAIGVRAVRPLVRAFGGLVGSEGLQAAVHRAERR